MNKIAFIIIFAAFALTYAQEVKLPDMADPNTGPKTSKNQWGIIGTLTEVFFKVRTCVMYTYDEIKYYESVKRSFTQMNEFFNENKNFIKALADSTQKVFTDPQNVFVTFDRLNTILDGVDKVRFTEARKFDEMLYGIENTYDKFAADTFEYRIAFVKSANVKLKHTPGLLIPNTAQLLGYIDRQIFGNESGTSVESSSNKNTVSIGEGLTDFDYAARDTAHNNWPDHRLRVANELVAAHCMANSAQYQLWAQRALAKVDSLDKKFLAASNNANEKELAAAWYALENINANNKQLRHNLLEAKLLQAMLGTDLYYQSNLRSSQLKNGIAMREISSYITSK
jgi:hypothetical protein